MKRLATTVAALAIAWLVLTSGPIAPLRHLIQSSHLGRPTVATRQTLEMVVMTLQVVGVLSLAWLKLSPASAGAGWTLMSVQVGLGLSGAMCAGFESGFALFAGVTLVVLLLGTMIQTEDAARPVLVQA